MGNRKSIGMEIGSILLFSAALFGFFSLGTYHASDPSVFTNAVGPARNSCGRVGAHFASSIFCGFGLSGFLVPVTLLFMAASVHKRESFFRVLAGISGMIIAVTAMSVFLSVYRSSVHLGGSVVLAGGVLGAWVAKGLETWLNPIGTLILAFSLFASAIVVSTPLSVSHFFGRFLAWAATGLAKIGLKLARETGAWAAQISKPSKPPHQTSKTRESDFSLSPSVSTDIELDSDLPEPTVIEAPKKGHEQRILRARTSHWKLPTIEFLKKPPKVTSGVDRERLKENSQILRQKFLDFGIQGEVTAVRPGPVITLYEFKPGPGVKVSRIAALADDLSMALSAQSVRILAPLPGKSVVGIEIPSDVREMVYLREFLQHPDFYGNKHSIPIVMGKEIGGQTYLADLARMPHLLCAGQTGSGKSVFMNGLICSLLYRFTPDELRMILVDPKFIEFRAYQDIPHLLLPVVDDPKQASIALKWAVREMERRYRILAKTGVRNLSSFNQRVAELGSEAMRDLLNSEEEGREEPIQSSTAGGDWLESFEPDEKGVPQVGKLPHIVIIIDELADLMMIAKKEVEVSIARIAQKARAAGIHLIIATQRPSTDVVTGLIKANLPSRASFQLASYVDSKTILDRAGAERLLGQGDMLFIPPGSSQHLRLHGAFVDDDEIGKIARFLKTQGNPFYRDEILLSDDEENENSDNPGSSEDSDELYEQAVELVQRSGHASASFIQRHLKVGYNRAARLIETMEGRGIVGPQDGSRPREVLKTL